MALGWFSSFKDIPWARVLELAPTLAEGGRKLWNRLANAEPEEAGAAQPPRKPEAPVAEQIAALEVRLQTVERRLAKLKDEATASFEVVRSITEQHSQVVHAVDVVIARTRVLLRVCVLLAVALVALLIVVSVK